MAGFGLHLLLRPDTGILFVRDLNALARMLEAEPASSIILYFLALGGAAFACIPAMHACSALRYSAWFCSQMFYSAKAFDQPVAGWNTASVLTMSSVRSLDVAPRCCHLFRS
jgi:hypothetical protein